MITVIVATYGTDEWRKLGERAAESVPGSAQLVVTHLPDGTLAQARNQGAAEAHTDWITWLDGDDRLSTGYIDALEDKILLDDLDAKPRYTETEVSYEPARVLLAPAVQYLTPTGRPIGVAEIPNRGRWPDLNVCVIGTLVPRALFGRVGGFREHPSLEDYDLWLRCVRAGAEIRYVDSAIYCATSRPDGRNQDQSTYFQLRREHASLWADPIR